jgi:hypothetical protein
MEQGFQKIQLINAVDMYCKDDSCISANITADWGSWKKEQKCPDDYAVMGIRTQFNEHPYTGDDTALNCNEFYCLPFPLK